MMRIKEAIQRRKLIQQLNDEYTDEPTKPGSATPSICGRRKSSAEFSRADSDEGEPSEAMTSIALHHFVTEFGARLTENHRRALRVTWKRLSESPKTSGRGTLQIMEKVFDRLLQSDQEIMGVFYKSAFVKCVEDRKRRCSSGSIATLRDHAHLMIDFIDAIMSIMFDMPMQKPVWDPATIGRAHARLIPLGFKRQVWHKLGECFAEVMFSQECVRAYPHAASAWSMLSVAWTDKMYTHSRQTRDMFMQPYTPTTFSTWSDPSPYTSVDSPYGFGSQSLYSSPLLARQARSRNRRRRHATPTSARSSRSTSTSRGNRRYESTESEIARRSSRAHSQRR